MFKNSRNSSNTASRWRMSFIALMLALVSGNTGQMPQAQAAPAGQSDVFFFMVLVGKPKTRLCVGQTATYSVKVEFESHGMPTPAPGPLGRLAHVNINVEASSENTSVGDFTNHNATTTVAAGDDLSGLLVASFPFKAREAGTTTLYFEGLVQGKYVSVNQPVRVVACKFKVKTSSNWNVPGPANIKVAAISGEAEVKAADADSPFTGSTSVNWAASASSVEDCSQAAITIGSTRVNWTGVMDDSGQLTLNSSFQSAAGSVDVHCVGSSGETVDGSTPVELTPDPIQVSVASSGGVIRQSQVLQGPEATPGFVTIIVIPEDDQAGAFSPGNAGASWDDFSRLFGAMLALY